MKPIILPVDHIQQGPENDCVAVCAAMVLNYLGISVTYDRLLRLLKANWFGIPSFRVQELEKLGITVIYKQGDLTELYEHLSNGRPCIAFVRTAELPYWSQATDHAVVVVGLDDTAVYLNDAEFDSYPVKVSHGDFDLAWLERDEYYATFIRRE